MVVPAYPIGAETVKSSGESLMLTGRGMAGSRVVGIGVRRVGTGVGTAVGRVVRVVVGTGAGVGAGWTVWVHPAARSRTVIKKGRITGNDIFISPTCTWQVIKISGSCFSPWMVLCRTLFVSACQ